MRVSLPGVGWVSWLYGVSAVSLALRTTTAANTDLVVVAGAVVKFTCCAVLFACFTEAIRALVFFVIHIRVVSLSRTGGAIRATTYRRAYRRA